MKSFLKRKWPEIVLILLILAVLAVNVYTMAKCKGVVVKGVYKFHCLEE